MKILYIGGAGRSGSTLLEMILGNIPGVFSMGEMSGFWGYLEEGHSLCGCGSPLEDCPIWSQVIDRLGLRSSERVAALARLSRKIDRTRNLSILPLIARVASGEIEELVQQIGLLYQSVAEVTRAQLLVDSSKVPLHLYLLRRVPSADLRIIHLVRDARAVAYSWNQRRKRQLATSQPGVYMDRRSLISSVVRWRVENAFMHGQGKNLTHYALIRYEDLVERPYDQLRQALDTVGLPDLDVGLLHAPSLRLQPTHSLGGNPVRFDNRDLHIVQDDEWRDKMSSLTRYGLGLLAGPLLRRYQYSL